MLAVALLSLWTVTLMLAVLGKGQGLPVFSDPHWPVCFMRVLIIAAVPACLLFVMVRRGVALRQGWTSALTAAAAAGMGALVVQLACPLDDPGHGFLGHFVPVMLMIAVAVAVRRIVAPRTS